MDKIYLIYEWYDHCYFGFADYKNKLVHFAFKDKSYPEYLFEIIPTTKKLLDYAVAKEFVDEDSDDMTLWDFMKENEDIVEIKKANVHLDSNDIINDPPYKNSFMDWLD